MVAGRVAWLGAAPRPWVASRVAWLGLHLLFGDDGGRSRCLGGAAPAIWGWWWQVALLGWGVAPAIWGCWWAPPPVAPPAPRRPRCLAGAPPYHLGYSEHGADSALGTEITTQIAREHGADSAALFGDGGGRSRCTCSLCCSKVPHPGSESPTRAQPRSGRAACAAPALCRISRRSTLAGQSLIRLELESGGVTSEQHLLQDEIGRIRDVRIGPDGLLSASLPVSAIAVGIARGPAKLDPHVTTVSSPIQAAPASSIAWRGRAATPPGSRRIWPEREMAAVAQRANAGRDAGGSASGSGANRRDRPVRRHPGLRSTLVRFTARNNAQGGLQRL